VSALPRSLTDRLAERYEDLRQQAQGGIGDRAGMVVLLRQGMRAWMEAWERWITSEPSRTQTITDRDTSPEVLPSMLRAEITLLLAGMALCREPFRRSGTTAGQG
jgi:hypothetical protein